MKWRPNKKMWPFLILATLGLAIIGYDLWLVISHKDSFTMKLVNAQSDETVQCQITLPHGKKPFHIFEMCIRSCKAQGFVQAPGEVLNGKLILSQEEFKSLQVEHAHDIPDACLPRDEDQKPL